MCWCPWRAIKYWVDVFERQLNNEFKACFKRGRPWRGKTHSLEEENTRKDIWNVALLKKLHIKWVIKMTDQSQVTPEEVQFKQVALWETYVLQLAL